MKVSITLSCLMIFMAFSDVKCDKRQWVDYTDMLHYDHRSKKMVYDENAPSNEGKTIDYPVDYPTGEQPEENTDCCLKATKYKASYEICEKERNKSICDAPISNGHTAYLQRFVAKILQQFSYRDENEIQRFEIITKLSSSGRQTLQNFVNSENVAVQDVDEIISELFVDAYPMTESGEYISFTWIKPEIKSTMPYLLLSFAGLCLLHISLKKSILFVFLLSVFWHWKRMYDDAVVKRHVAIMENPSIPKACTAEKMTFWEGIFNWWSTHQMKNQDECEKYFTFVMVDPFWDISPTMAISQTIAAFITTPFALIGKNIGLFFTSFYHELPPWIFYFLVPLMLIFFVLIFAICFGYRVQLPGFVAIEPGQHERRRVIQDVPRNYVEAQVEQPRIRGNGEEIATRALSNGVRGNTSRKTIRVETERPEKKSCNSRDNKLSNEEEENSTAQDITSNKTFKTATEENGLEREITGASIQENLTKEE